LAYNPPVSAERLLQFHEMVKDFPASKFGNVKPLSWDWRMWMDAFDREQILDFYLQHVVQGREDLP
jgi:hypothetical protein